MRQHLDHRAADQPTTAKPHFVFTRCGRGRGGTRSPLQRLGTWRGASIRCGRSRAPRRGHHPHHDRGCRANPPTSPGCCRVRPQIGAHFTRGAIAPRV
jgi:hypothetical protein